MDFLVKIMKENGDRKSIENDFTIVINDNNVLPSIICSYNRCIKKSNTESIPPRKK